MLHKITWYGALLLAALAVPSAVRADETEFRDYRVLVEGKESGFSQMTITRRSDGAMNMTGSAAVRVGGVLFTYNFNSESSEWWKDGQLMNLKTTTTENGKKTEVTATATPQGMQVRVNNQPRMSRTEIWPSSFWKLLDAKYHNKEVAVLEADTGKEYTGKLQYIATEDLPVLGQNQKCYHFRITGGPSPVDVWYDRYYLLVRQDFVDTGHRTSVQLIKIRR